MFVLCRLQRINYNTILAFHLFFFLVDILSNRIDFTLSSMNKQVEGLMLTLPVCTNVRANANHIDIKARGKDASPVINVIDGTIDGHSRCIMCTVKSNAEVGISCSYQRRLDGTENFAKHSCNALTTTWAADVYLHLRAWVYHKTEQHYWQSTLGAKVYAAGLNTTTQLVKRTLKAGIIVLQAYMVMNIPAVAALSQYELDKVGPSVYGQLAQGAVIACFAVLLTGAATQRPIHSLAYGPLSSVSSAQWLWMNRGEKSKNNTHMVGVNVSGDYDPKRFVRRQVLYAIPGIFITISSFVVYLLSSLNDHLKWNWALSITILGILSEVSRLLATWLTITSMKTKPYYGTNLVGAFPRFGASAKNRPFIQWRPNTVLRAPRQFSEFTFPRHAVPGQLLGRYVFTWYWEDPITAMISFSLFCFSTICIMLSTGALIASGDASIAAAFLSMLLCLSGSGFTKLGYTSVHQVLDEYADYSSSTRAKDIMYSALSPFRHYSVIKSHYALGTSVDNYLMACLLSNSGTVTLGNTTLKTFKVEQGLTINMHDVFYAFTDTQPLSRRIMDWRNGDSRRSTLLETADALYCRALLLIKHADACKNGNDRCVGSKCNANIYLLMSAVLLASQHTECSDVCEILTEIKAWMNNEELLWSIIGSIVTLDMIMLPHLKFQLESSNTLDLALRICHMAMYENVPSGDMLEAVPTALYFLLTGDTAFGSSMATIVEHAIYKFGAADVTLALDQVTMQIDRYKLKCHGKLHDWPGGPIPLLDPSENTYQTRYNTLAKAVFGTK